MTVKIPSLSTEDAYSDVGGWSGLQKGQAHAGMSCEIVNNAVAEQDMVEIILQRMLGRIEEPTK